MTIALTFPDQTVRNVEQGVTGMEVAESISKSLAKKAVAMKLNGELVDLSDQINTDAHIQIVTRDDEDALQLIRHDCAHVLAEAVQELWPGTQVTIGPVIENGFYYDFARNQPFTTEEFETIEAKMHEIIGRNQAFSKEIWSRDEAKAFFTEKGESFKVELVDAIPEDDDIRIYRQGDWLDLCRGPHMPSTGKIGSAFKLMKVAGAYWRGDSKNQVLSRIYGTAWANEKQLKQYMHMLEEAEKRDHRRLGKEMGLFHLQEEAQGSVFWHPNGFTIYNQMENYIRRRLIEDEYVEVKTPQLMNSKFWEQSGHWSKFREDMFIVPDEIPSQDDEQPVISGDAKLMALKPMNCPAHVQIFNQGIKSYRDLPIRMAEFGCCHRNEAHGALHGLMRVRQMTQDDAHIFCRDDQITSESAKFCSLLYSIYKDLGFEDVNVLLATRPELRAGHDDVWDRAENGLAAALHELGIAFEYAPGEGAFYGPKLEFHLRDAIGRSWQCGTLQLDFVLPERLDASYVGSDGEKHRPVMLHRAILGSLERFIGIMIEDSAGRLPLWLAPKQLVVTSITTEFDDYAKDVANRAGASGLRVDLDLRNEKINYKVREHSHAKIPAIFVVGGRERDEGTVSIRRLGSKDQKTEDADAAISALQDEATPPDLRR